MKRATPKNLLVKTYPFPGKWMSDQALDKLREKLSRLAAKCLGNAPSYGVFLRQRSPYTNRIITVVFDKVTGEAVGFAAMVVWTIRLEPSGKREKVVHLGLVMVDPAYRGKMIMYWIYHRPLSRYFFKRMGRPFWITSTTAEPVIFGSVADNFSQVYPVYRECRKAEPSDRHRQIAETFVREFGHEIGLSESAWFEPAKFIIRDSSLGASKELMHDYAGSAKYRDEACNAFCRDNLHYERGDEFIQVGRVDLRAILRGLWWNMLKLKKKLEFS